MRQLLFLSATVVGIALSALFSAAAEDHGLLDEMTVGGVKMKPSSPPAPLVLREHLGLLTVPGLDGHIVHVATTHLFETRATITPDGDYLLMFPEGDHYGGRGKYDKRANRMMAYRSSDRGKTWQGPTVAWDVPYGMHGFIPLIPRGSKRIYCFGTEPIAEEREGGENCPIGFRHSDDDGRSWSGVTLIRPENDPGFKGMSVMRMCETDSGAWIVGSHAADWTKKPLTTRQYLLRSEDQGKTWTVLPGERPKGWFVEGLGRMDEARPINLGGGRVLLLARTPEGHQWTARSDDDGKTWTTPKPSPLIHPDAPPMLFHAGDGKTLVAFHHNRHSQTQYAGLTAKMEGQKDRSEIWVSTSSDGGRTWSEPRFVFANALAPDPSKSAWHNHQCSYLDAFADGDTLHLFLPHRWKRALHLTIKASDLVELPTKAVLLARNLSADGAQEHESKYQPADVVGKLLGKKIDDETDIGKYFFLPSVFVDEIRGLREFLASDRRPPAETLFTIQEGFFAVVAIGIRAEGYRDGIDIDPVFLINKDGWKVLLERDDPRYRLDAKAIRQLEKLESLYDEREEVVRAAIAEKRAKALDVSVDNVHGLWHQTGGGKLSVLNLGRNGKFVSADISNGKLSNRIAGEWAIEGKTLVLAVDQETGPPVKSRFGVDRITVDQLVTVNENDRSKKGHRSRVTDRILKLFPDLRVPQKQAKP